MTTLQEKMAAEDRLTVRDLAQEAGTALTDPRDRANPDRVLAAAAPIRDWLQAGPGGALDRRARRMAVRRHLRNLTFAKPRPSGRDMQDFLACAEQYYADLTGG